MRGSGAMRYQCYSASPQALAWKLLFRDYALLQFYLMHG